VTIAAKLGQVSRFGGARQLMGYCGAVPSEDSSGKRTRRGSITKTGNAHLRRIASPGNVADHRYLAMVNLYWATQRQAMLLSYMDQFRMICGIILCLLPLVFFLKRPPAQKHVELEVH
jgi:hypothetical protein